MNGTGPFAGVLTDQDRSDAPAVSDIIAAGAAAVATDNGIAVTTNTGGFGKFAFDQRRFALDRHRVDQIAASHRSGKH